MKNIFIGILIVIVVFLIIDFIYTEKNTCIVAGNTGWVQREAKCGIIKNQFDIDINLFGRYW